MEIFFYRVVTKKGYKMKVILSLSKGKFLLFNGKLIEIDMQLVKYISSLGVQVEFVR